MIIVKGRELLIPENERYIGTTYDDNSTVRTFRIPRFHEDGMDKSQLDFYVIINYDDGSDPDAVGVVKAVNDDYIVLEWDVGEDITEHSGCLYLWVRGFDYTGTVRWSSFPGVFYIETSGTEPSDLSDLEERISEEDKLIRLAKLYKSQPMTAATAAEMINREQIYVYVGDEEGYQYGHWYFWDGSAWVSGGVYNAVAVQTDKSLSQEDFAADAKAVGVVKDALNATPFMAERIFRKVLVRNAAGEANVGSQAITNTGNTIICAGRTLPDDSTQKIDEYDLSGNLIRTRTYANADLGHMNDITYDADRGLLYVAGTGAKVVAVRYSDLMVVAVHTITNIEGIASLDYDNGILYAGGGKTTGVIDLDTWAYVVKITYDPAETSQNYSAVRQGMAAHDGYIYLVYNWTNQLIKINATTWEVERSILIGKGNGEYPYGEAEGVTFVGRQMYLLTAVWFASYTTTDYEGSILQVFKTNVGGPLAVHDRDGQSTGGQVRIVNVNESNSDSTALNPDGTPTRSFYSLLEACAFINYQAEINKNWTFSLQINQGDQHDYSKDAFVLTNMTVYVRAHSGAQLRDLVFRNCVVFLRQITANYIEFSYSIARIYGVTATRIRSLYTVLYKSLLNRVDDFDMEGTTFFPLASSDTENISNFVTSEIPVPLYVNAEVTSEYLMGALKLDRYGRNAVLSYDSTFTIPANTETTICTLPEGFRPVRLYVYDMVDSPIAAGGEMKRVRVYLDPSGTVRFFNYNDITEFTNMRLLIPYITKHLTWSVS